MTRVNMLEAKTHLSRHFEAIESGAESEIVIARDGKPAARLVPVDEEPRSRASALPTACIP
jgi:antitoxin (DNA-binding transcriptional repressor) of toxin-antitoxin stability system